LFESVCHDITFTDTSYDPDFLGVRDAENEYVCPLVRDTNSLCFLSTSNTVGTFHRIWVFEELILGVTYTVKGIVFVIGFCVPLLSSSSK